MKHGCRWLFLFALTLASFYAPPSRAESQRQQELKRAKELTQREDEERPDQQLTLYLYERPLIIGGELEFESRYQGDFRLDPDRADDEARLRPQLELEAYYAMTRNLSLFLEAKLGYERDVYSEAGDKENEWQPRRGEMWLNWQDIGESGFSLRVGRQNLRDKREWWWDSDLDAVRFFYEIDDFEFQLSVAQELGPEQANRSRIQAELEDVFFVLGQGTWYWQEKNHIDLFFARRRDHSNTHRVGDIIDEDREDEFDANLWWLGARAMGRWKIRPLGAFHYWADFAYVRGDESIIDFDSLDTNPERSEVDTVDRVHVSGFGADTGVTFDPRRGYWPRLTLGYAWGSGGGRADGTDRSFRQTGLHDNNAKFRGVDRFKYYGELFRPELSNMHITTVSVGFPLLHSSSVEFLYHVYWQDRESSFIRETRLKAGPEGTHRSLGQELNIVIGLEEWIHWEVEIIGGFFRAGSAFGPLEHKWSHLGLLQVEYNF